MFEPRVAFDQDGAEAGDAEQVVRDPKHPYTQLLIGSIPYPDPNRHWKGEAAPSAEGALSSDHGCRFASRCPSAMAVCRDSVPPMFRTGAHRGSACYLYRDGEVVPAADLGAVLVQGDGAV